MVGICSAATTLGMLGMVMVFQAAAGATSVRVANWGHCEPSQLLSRMSAIQQACCGGAAGSPSSTCASGIPERCTASCAEAYLPFFTDCHFVLAQQLVYCVSRGQCMVGRGLMGPWQPRDRVCVLLRCLGGADIEHFGDLCRAGQALLGAARRADAGDG